MTALCIAARAEGQLTWKLYDVRDVIASMSPAPPLQIATPESTRQEPLYSLIPTDPAPQDPPAQPGDELISRLCGVFGARFVRLFPGLYGIETEEADHARILQMLDEIRAVFHDRFDVELLLYATACDEAPRTGETAEPVAPFHRHHLVVTRRTPTPLTRVSLHNYVAGLRPVVAQGSAAYDIDTQAAADGLQLTILVGAGESDAHTTPFEVTGDLRRVNMEKASAPVTHQGADLHVDLPRVDVRSIQSSLDIELGKPTVVNIVDGFTDGECFVLSATVRRLDD
jgi:hypothetical protein